MKADRPACVSSLRGRQNEHASKRPSRRLSDGLTTSEVEKLPLTWYVGAEDGIRTRDPHLGKVVFSVCWVGSSPPPGGPVHPVSTPSTESAPVVERSASGAGGFHIASQSYEDVIVAVHMAGPFPVEVEGPGGQREDLACGVLIVAVFD